MNKLLADAQARINELVQERNTYLGALVDANNQLQALQKK